MEIKRVNVADSADARVRIASKSESWSSTNPYDGIIPQ